MTTAPPSADTTEWAPFGRGRTTAGALAVTMLLLVLACRYGAGPYGFAAVPVLLLQFVLTGVVAGRAAAGLLRRAWRPLTWLLSVGVGIAVAFADGRVWALRGSDQTLLLPMFAVTLGAAVAWAACATAETRTGAAASAAVSAVAVLASAVGGW